MNSSKFLSDSSDMFENGVHVGTSGWLFLAEGTNDVRKLYCDPNFLSDEDIQKWRLLLLQRKLKLETASIEYLHVWVPEKLSIYSEFLGPDFPPRTLGPAQRVACAEINSFVLDLGPSLIEAKKIEQVYWKTDTHWTFSGACAALEAICHSFEGQAGRDHS